MNTERFLARLSQICYAIDTRGFLGGEIQDRYGDIDERKALVSLFDEAVDTLGTGIIYDVTLIFRLENAYVALKNAMNKGSLTR